MCQPKRGCVRTDRREGRDSFEPRLVFASPCVPRTSYFNETVCLRLFLSPVSRLPVSPRLFVHSFPLALSLVTNGPLSSRTIPSFTIFLFLSAPLSLFLSLHLYLSFFVRLSYSPSRSRVLLYHAVMRVFFLSPSQPHRFTSPSSLDTCALIKKKRRTPPSY